MADPVSLAVRHVRDLETGRGIDGLNWAEFRNESHTQGFRATFTLNVTVALCHVRARKTRCVTLPPSAKHEGT